VTWPYPFFIHWSVDSRWKGRGSLYVISPLPAQNDILDNRSRWQQTLTLAWRCISSYCSTAKKQPDHGSCVIFTALLHNGKLPLPCLGRWT